MKNASLFNPGDPPRATMQHKGERVVNGHVVHYTKKRQQSAIDYWTQFGADVRGKLGGTLKGPVHISVYFLFHHPKNTPKAKAEKCHFRTVRPDLDNMVKGLLDGFSRAKVWEDDSQVVSMQLEKLSVPEERCGTEVRIYEYDT